MVLDERMARHRSCPLPRLFRQLHPIGCAAQRSLFRPATWS